jgi:hypothetical protein
MDPGKKSFFIRTGVIMFWIMLAIYAATTVLSGLLQKAPKIKASSLGEIQVPTAEEGRNLPVIWGTCCLQAPNVVWYSDYKVQPIKKSMGIMAFGRTYTAGYRYYLGMDLALCHGPVDELVDILAGTGEDLKKLSWRGTGDGLPNIIATIRLVFQALMSRYSSDQPGPGPVTNPDGSISLYVAAQTVFGGDEKEGGIAGAGRFYPGNDTQESNNYISTRMGITYPAYRKICHMVCSQWYMGTSQYMKKLAFVLRRTPSNLGLTSGQANIGGDANPAEIIYECLKMKHWGLGFPDARFNLNSFKLAGQTLSSEGFGMSLMMDSPQQADKTIETVLQHIDGVCYQDPSTGHWTLKLIRPDYDVASIPEFDEHDIAECEFSRGSWEDTLNEVKVTYTDRNRWKKGLVQAHEPANFAIRQGELATQTIDFSGFSNATAAQKACNRELRTHSYPIGKGRVRINRKGWPLRMGSPFKLTWSPLGISGMAVRVTSIDYGNLTDGMIEVEFCEDIFKANYTSYAPPSSSSWTDPAGDPVAPTAQLAIEAPYQMLDGITSPHVLVGAVRGDGVSLGYSVMTDEGAGYVPTNEASAFCPCGLLQTAYPRNTASLDAVGLVVIGTDLEILVSIDAAGRDRGDSLLYFADTGEICAWQSIVDNVDETCTITGIVRGVYDTIPADHAAGTRVYFIRNGGADYLADFRATVLADSEQSIILND